MTAVRTALVLILAAASCSPRAQVEVRREVYLMGTTVSLETRATDREDGVARLESFIRILEDTERQLSTWLDASDLSILNRQTPGVPLRLGEPLCGLLAELEGWSSLTGRSFDPAVGALIEVWGLRGSPRVPGAAEIEAALGRSGLDRVRLDPDTCEAVRLADVRLDAGAFGKGEALDRVAASVEGRTAAWMVDIGGQVMVHGVSSRIYLAHPADRTRPVLPVTLSSGSLATSGGSERDAVAPGGERVGHIVDPRTGRTVTRDESVVVWHERALAADVLSTALYVMGPDEGFRWAEAQAIAACFLVPVGDTVEARPTTAFRVRFFE